MRFYQECVRVAQSVGTLMTEEQLAAFADTITAEHRYVLGMWVGNHLLPQNPYLHEALEALGLTTAEEKTQFLITFAQQYWILFRRNLL